MVKLKYWAKSDIGLKRAQNEDCFYADDQNGFFIIADGMGGHRGGDKASKLAVQTATTIFLQNKENPQLALKEAFTYSAKEVYQASITIPELRGMGTTLSAIAFENDMAHIAHIGDSRIYYIRNGLIKQITNDHSLVNEQVSAGILSPEEAKISSLRNVITKAIGHKKIVYPDFLSFKLEKGDIILLCTDGLNNMITDEEICKIINSSKLEKAVDSLIRAANTNGGYDNITIILIKILAKTVLL